MAVANRAYLIITKILHGPNTLKREHTHVEYTLLVYTIAKYYNYNILIAKQNNTSGYLRDLRPN